jgi:hypothetical protein
MSAPALNAAFTVAPQAQPAAGAAPSGAAAGAFEALMGALFGTQDSLGAVLLAGAAPAAEGKTEDADLQDGEAAATDEAQALAGLFATPLPLTISAPVVTAPEGGGDSTAAGANAGAALPAATDGDALAQALTADPTKPADAKAAAEAAPRMQPAPPVLAQALAAEPAPLPATPEPVADAPEGQQLAAAETLPPPPPAEDKRATPARRETQASAPVLQAQDAAPAPSIESKAEAAKPDLKVAVADEPALAAVEPAAPDARPADPQGQAPAQTSAPAAAQHATLAAATPVRGSPETVANLTAQIVKKLEGRSTRFDVELDPAGLGRVDVRVEIGQHGKITAALTFDNPQAANELRSRGGELSRALEQAGFDLSGGLSFDVADQRGQQGQGAGGGQADDGASWRGKAFQAALDQAGETVEAAVNGALNLQRRWNAGVDIRI